MCHVTVNRADMPSSKVSFKGVGDLYRSSLTYQSHAPDRPVSTFYKADTCY